MKTFHENMIFPLNAKITYFQSRTELEPKVTILEGQNLVLEQHFQLWTENDHIFTISLNRNNNVFQLNKPQQVVTIVEALNNACNSLIQIFSIIKGEADNKL